MKKILFIIALCFTTQLHARDHTELSKIRVLNHVVKTGATYVITSGRWKARESGKTDIKCEPYYIVLHPSYALDNDLSKVSSLLMMARSMQLSVKFYGQCHTNPDFFIANQLLVY